MRRTPVALFAASAMLALTACNLAREAAATLGDLYAVQQRVAAIAGTPNVSVNLRNGTALRVAVANVPLTADRMRQIAGEAYRAYPSRSALQTVEVSLVTQRTYFGFVHYTETTETRQYRPNDLVEQPALVERWVPPAPRRRLYLVALGGVEPDLVAWLADHVRERFGIAAEPLPPIAFDRVMYDRRRDQVVAEELISAIRNRHPAIWRDETARVIGVTGDDMYLRSASWEYGFSMRSDDDRMAVVSYSRMDPSAFGGTPDEDLLKSRLAKMVGKDVGVLCFGLPLSKNPQSLMYATIGGPDDLDAMTEFVDPR